MADLPSFEDAYYRLESFSWCQVSYVFARELTRRNKDLEWHAAYGEALDVVEAIQAGDASLTVDATLSRDLVYWPDVLCAANAYASLDPGYRGWIRKRYAEGASVVALPMSLTGGCDRKVLDDEEYKPAPPCMPSEEAKLGWIAAGTFALTFLATLGLRLVTRTKR